MSIAADSSVSMILGDYAAEDAAKKINILGAGWHVAGVLPSGVAAPQTLVVFWQVPAKYRGQEFAASVTLLNASGDPVQFPSTTGESTRLRVQRLYTVDPPQVTGIFIPSNVPSAFQIVLRLENGLPISANELYTWQFEIDGNPKQSLSFYVAGPRPPVVVG